MPELNKYPFGMTLNGMTPGLPGKDDRYSSGVTEEQKPESTQLNYTPKQAESLLKNYSKSGYKGIHQKNVTLDGQEGTLSVSRTHNSLLKKGGEVPKITFYPRNEAWINQMNQDLAKAEFATNLPLHLAPFVALATGGTALAKTQYRQNPKFRANVNTLRGRGMQIKKDFQSADIFNPGQITINATPVSGKPIPSETSASVLGKNSMFRRGSKSEQLAINQRLENQAVQDALTSKAPQPGQPYAMAYENVKQEVLQSTFPKGPGSDPLKHDLKKQIGDVLIANQERIGLKPSHPDFIDRQDLFNIQDVEGLRYRVKKIDKYMKSVAIGEPNVNLLQFQSFTSHYGAAARRKDATTAPEDVIKKLSRDLFPDNIELADKLSNQYLSTYQTGFGRTKEAARRAGISVRQRSKEIETGEKTLAEDKFMPQVDAGHWVAAGTGGSTDSHAARLEDASANRSAGDDIEHNINPYAAKMAGIASTFPEAFVNFVDRQLGLNTIPDWKVDFSAKEIRIIESIPQHWGEKEVKEVFIQMKRDRKHDPKFNFGKGTKFTAEDLKPMDEIDPDNIYRKPNWRENAEGFEGPMTQKEKDAYDLEMAKKSIPSKPPGSLGQGDPNHPDIKQLQELDNQLGDMFEGVKPQKSKWLKKAKKNKSLKIKK